MRQTLIILALLSLCRADTLQVSFMPSYLDFDSLHVALPLEPGEVIDSTLPNFKQFALDSGKVCPKDGILISDRKAAEYVFYKLGYERQAKELKLSKYLMKETCDKTVSAEKIYQAKIAALEKSNRRTWLEKNLVYFGVVAGIATAVLTEFAVFQAGK